MTQITEQEQFEQLYKLSVLLNTGLDRETLLTCVSMIEVGVNVEALVMVLKEIKSK